MGYSSLWSMWPLEVNNPEDRFYFEQAVEYLREPDSDPWWALEADGGTNEWYGWRDWDDDMKRMTEEFPLMVFVLKCIGEDYDEDSMWIEYWKNGRVQHEPAVITYGDFDERKLK